MAASRETPTPSLLSISQLEGPVQLPSVLGASQAVWRELGAILWKSGSCGWSHGGGTCLGFSRASAKNPGLSS